MLTLALPSQPCAWPPPTTRQVSIDRLNPHGQLDESGTVLELHFASEQAANVHLLGAIFGEASRTDLPKEAAPSSCGTPRAAGALAPPLSAADARVRSRSRTGSLGRPRYLAQQLAPSASARRGEVDSSPPRGAVRAKNVWQLRFDTPTELQAWRADIERLKAGHPMDMHICMHICMRMCMYDAMPHVIHHVIKCAF